MWALEGEEAGAGDVTMVVVCGGALTVVGALDDGEDSFGVKVGLCWGRCWVHCFSYGSNGGCFLGVCAFAPGSHRLQSCLPG